MQRLHTSRIFVRAVASQGRALGRSRRRLGAGERGASICAESRGFTLIELMVTIAVLAIVGAAAFAGFRQDEYRNAHRDFVDDLEGVLIQARGAAIDRQTQVQVTFDATSVEVREFDNTSNTWDLIERKTVTGRGAGLLEGGSGVCLHGLASGVQAPSQAEDVTPPASCLVGDQVLLFDADGSFSDPNADFVTLDNAGVTLWVGDRRVSGEVKYSIIQLFPGGLIRSFESIQGVGS